MLRCLRVWKRRLDSKEVLGGGESGWAVHTVAGRGEEVMVGDVEGKQGLDVDGIDGLSHHT